MDDYDLKALAELPTDPLADYSVDDLFDAIKQKYKSGQEVGSFIGVRLRIDGADEFLKTWWEGGCYTAIGLAEQFKSEALNGFPHSRSEEHEEE